MKNLNDDFFGNYIDSNKELFKNIKSWVEILENSTENQIKDIVSVLNKTRSNGKSSEVLGLMFALKSMNIEY